MEKFNIYNGDATVQINVDDEMKTKIFNKIVEFIKDLNCTSGEQLQQSDSCLLEAPELISDILDDIIKPQTKWK